MLRSRGIANLPLHWGKAPPWLFEKMVRLGREITAALVLEFGPREVLIRLSDPYWFQALGAVLGFDWHSSGVTTTVCGALKEGIRGQEHDLGLFIAGGKGATSRQTPVEIGNYAPYLSVDPQPLVYASRMAAKVDSVAVQDGYTLYHHVFVFTREGEWCVVQQGMNSDTRYARRYHWISSAVSDFVCEPESAICCDCREESVLDLIAADSGKCRQAVALLSREKPERLLAELKAVRGLELPERHPIKMEDIHPDRLQKIFLSTYDRQPGDFKKLLEMPGVGAKTVRALSLLAELLYGAPASFSDPARYSFAHGGKDGHPYPVDLESYGKSISFLETAVRRARVGDGDKLKSLRSLEAWWHQVSKEHASVFSLSAKSSPGSGTIGR